jgi:hypothetical protein
MLDFGDLLVFSSARDSCWLLMRMMSMLGVLVLDRIWWGLTSDGSEALILRNKNDLPWGSSSTYALCSTRGLTLSVRRGLHLSAASVFPYPLISSFVMTFVKLEDICRTRSVHRNTQITNKRCLRVLSFVPTTIFFDFIDFSGFRNIEFCDGAETP